MLPSISPAEASLELLQSRGILRVQLPALEAEEADAFLTDWVHRWGRPHLHDTHGQLVWDVRSQPRGQARSHGMDEFPLHTDASFEDPPPRYVGLLVLKADSHGGGQSLWVSSSEVLARLSPASREALRGDFRMRVPHEFCKDGQTDFFGPIYAPPDFIRYRRETLCPPEDRHQTRALEELDHALTGPVHRLDLPPGCLLLLDNWRCFHGRTPVQDARRHLKRVRFFGPSIPPTFGVERFLPQAPLPDCPFLPGSGQPRPQPGPDSWDPWKWGIDLFNHGYYWEAHEAWEQLWQESVKDSAHGLVLRGLIQTAAACLKSRQNQSRGLEILRQRALHTLTASGQSQWRDVSLTRLQGRLSQLQCGGRPLYLEPAP